VQKLGSDSANSITIYTRYRPKRNNNGTSNKTNCDTLQEIYSDIRLIFHSKVVLHLRAAWNSSVLSGQISTRYKRANAMKSSLVKVIMMML